MFSYKTYLKLGTTPENVSQGTNILDFLSSTEIADFTFNFNQGIDQKGQPNTGVRGGIMTVIIPNIPSKEIMQWGLTPKGYKDGMIYCVNIDGQEFKKFYFHNASCVDITINYSSGAFALATLTIVADEILIGMVKHNNNWNNL